MPKRILFRADANSKIGAGHLIRSMALAQRCASLGWDVRFITAPLNGELANYLRAQKFDIRFLPISHAKCGTKEDLNLMLSEAKEGFDWVVLDNYYFDYDYQKAIRQSGPFVLVMDEQNRRLFDADLILNCGWEAHQLGYERTAGDALCLLGPAFVLMREELTRSTKKSKENLNNLLITLGCTVHSVGLEKIIEAIEQIDEIAFHAKILLSFGYSAKEIPQASRLKKHRLEVCRATFHVQPFYDWADLAICAGGSTCWELCYFGIVGFVGVLSENQESLARALDKANVFTSIGWFRDATPKGIADSVRFLINNPAVVAERRKRAINLVDGKGAERVLDVMMQIQQKRGQPKRFAKQHLGATALHLAT